MAQPSVYFSAGRLTMLQRNVLDAAGMERLLSTASLPEARKTLSELGWTGADITDPEQLAADRVNQAAQDARALSPEPALVDCFLYAYDAANLKMLLKARLLGLSAPALSDCGTIPADTLHHAVTDHRYSTLPAAFRDAMNRLEQNIVTGIDPMSIDVAIDRAMYQLIFSRLKGTHSPVTLQYFRGHVDLLNAVALLRVRQMKKDETFFMSVLLDGGTIRAQSWLLCAAGHAVRDARPVWRVGHGSGEECGHGRQASARAGKGNGRRAAGVVPPIPLSNLSGAGGGVFPRRAARNRGCPPDSGGQAEWLRCGKYPGKAA